MASIQAFLHNNINAHRYGTSHSNQRIESLWSHYKRTYTNWIIDYFKDMVTNDDLCLGDRSHMECAWFVYSRLLQNDLDKMKLEWNTHLIRKSRHARVTWMPDELYYMPELYGYQQRGLRINSNVLPWVWNQRVIHGEADNVLNEIDEDLHSYFRYVVDQLGISLPPRDWVEAKTIYNTIISAAS